jgi:hypothetical protein
MVRTTPVRKKKFTPDNFAPVVITKDAGEVEQVLLFSMVEDDGEQRDFYIPKKVKFTLTLQAADVLEEKGETAAGIWMLKKLIGEEGFKAIAYSDDVTEEQFNQVVEIATNIVLGPREGKAQ